MSLTGSASAPHPTTRAHHVAGAVATCAAAGVLVGGLATTAGRAPPAAIATGTTVAVLLLAAAIGGRSELSAGGIVALSLTCAGIASVGLAGAHSQGTTAASAVALTGWSAVALVLALRPGARRLRSVAIAAPLLAFGVAGLGALAILSSTAFEAVALLAMGAPLGLLLLAVAGDRWWVALGLGAAAGALCATTDLDRLTVLPGLVALALGVSGFLLVMAGRQPVGVVDAELVTMAALVGVLGAGLWSGPASLATAAAALMVVRRVPPIPPDRTDPHPRVRAQPIARVVDEGEPWW